MLGDTELQQYGEEVNQKVKQQRQIQVLNSQIIIRQFQSVSHTESVTDSNFITRIRYNLQTFDQSDLRDLKLRRTLMKLSYLLVWAINILFVCSLETEQSSSRHLRSAATEHYRSEFEHNGHSTHLRTHLSSNGAEPSHNYYYGNSYSYSRNRRSSSGSLLWILIVAGVIGCCCFCCIYCFIKHKMNKSDGGNQQPSGPMGMMPGFMQNMVGNQQQQQGLYDDYHNNNGGANPGYFNGNSPNGPNGPSRPNNQYPNLY